MPNKQKTKKKRKASTWRRLVWANVIAALALLTTSVITLWALGLLPSVLVFFF